MGDVGLDLRLGAEALDAHFSGLKVVLFHYTSLSGGGLGDGGGYVHLYGSLK